MLLLFLLFGVYECDAMRSVVIVNWINTQLPRFCKARLLGEFFCENLLIPILLDDIFRNLMVYFLHRNKLNSHFKGMRNPNRVLISISVNCIYDFTKCICDSLPFLFPLWLLVLFCLELSVHGCLHVSSSSSSSYLAVTQP